MSNRKPKRDANYLPAHQGEAFLRELDDLVVELSQTEGFKGQYLLSEYRSKYSDPYTVTPDQRRTAAISKWLAVEETNRKTNERLLLGEETFWLHKRDSEGNRVAWSTSDSLISKARQIVSDVLGSIDSSNVFVGGNHTNGASTRIRRSPKAALEKHTGQAHVSSSALKHWLRTASNTVLSSQTLAIQDDSVMFTVPKATEIDRVACKEPEINMFLQRAVGSHISRRLRRHGIDLNDQTVNQELARRAYRDGLATIDLSSASDSISTQLVCELLPVDWFCLLNDLRVKTVNIDGKTHDLQMFSSMGNGFTFELESLIFYALTRAICYLSGVRGRISVYGDDIIAPSVIGPRLKRTFAWFGFKVNAKKSNWSGPFRESCGKHYHNSLDVTPFYVRGPIRQKTDVIRILNRLLQWDAGLTWCLWHPGILAFHEKWSRIIPSNLHGGYDAESDSALVTGDAPRKKLVRTVKAIEDFSQLGAYLWWLTTRETITDEDQYLFCDPAEQSTYYVGDQPGWLYSSPWDPYAIAYDSPSGGTSG